MTKIKPVKAWAVVDPEDNIITASVAYNEIFSKRKITGKLNTKKLVLEEWEFYKAKGYRCIPVTITPEGE